MTEHHDRLSSILVVEDSDEDFEALSRIIAQVCTFAIFIHRCSSGDDALDFLNREGKYKHIAPMPTPQLMLLDLNLPGTDGREVLETIKQSQILRTMPIIAFSTSSNPKDIEFCYRSGVNGYMLKPMNIDTLKHSIKTTLDYWFQVMLLPPSMTP